jgi:superfamily I DNA/RNA helicase
MRAQHENNYWDLNPELLLLEEFDKFRFKDKSKDKQDSSKIMWAIFYAFHPESKFFNYPNKLEVLQKDFIKDPKFKWDSVKNIIDAFKNLVLSDVERALINWNEIMIMRDNSLKELYKQAIEEGDTDELVKLDKMLSNTPKMFEDYKKIKRDYEEEKVTKKGKSISSISDSGEI